MKIQITIVQGGIFKIIVKVFLFLCLFIAKANAGNEITEIEGRVLDAQGGSPLPYVHIVTNSGKGTVSDIEGYFSLSDPDGIEYLQLSYMGYRNKTVVFDEIEVPDDQHLQVFMHESAIDFNVFDIRPGDNPAISIIEQTNAARSRHNPLLLPSFRYEAYNRALVTNDLAQGEHPDIEELLEDTTTREQAEFLSNHHFFMMESVIERKFQKNYRNEEEVKAMRASGFEKPYFLELGLALHVFNFYEDEVKVNAQLYKNPIGPNATNIYYFNLRDTLMDEQDTIWVIDFRPQSKRLNTLEGTLFIHNKDKALQKVSVESSDHAADMKFFLNQNYTKLPSGNWFPKDLNMKLKMPDILNFELSAGNRNLNAEVYWVSHTDIQSPVLFEEIPRSDFSRYGYYVPEEAYKKDESFWLNYRDTLSKTEQNTYSFIDSLGKKHNFDRILHGGGALFTEGFLPVSIFNIDLSQILLVNQFEGIRPGVGLHTNRRFSDILSPGGYIAYGFKDKKFKYGGHLQIRLHDYTDTRLRLEYSNDVERPGREKYVREGANPVIDNFLINSVGQYAEDYEKYRAFVVSRFRHFTRAELHFEKQRRKSRDDYVFHSEDHQISSGGYRLAEAGFNIRYAYGEELYRTGDFFTIIPSSYPVFNVKYQRGFSDLLDGQFNYNRFTFRITQSFNKVPLGETQWTVEAGIIDNPVPVSRMFTGSGSLTGDNYHYFIPGAFQTMGVNEFLHDTEIAFNLQQDLFRRVWQPGTIEPIFTWWGQAGWGKIDEPEVHQNFSVKDMSQGYFEQGLLVKNLFNEFGIGIFYRHGPYSHNRIEENLHIKAAWTRQLESLF